MKNIKETLKTGFLKFKTIATTNVLLFTFVITTVINSIILRGMTVNNVFYIKPVIADLTIAIFVGSFAYFFKPKNRFKYFFFWALVFSLVCIINAVYYKNYLSFASFSLLTTLTQLGGYTDAVVENILSFQDFIYLWQFFCLIFVHLQLRKKQYYENVEKIEIRKIRFLNTIVVTLIMLGFFMSMLTGLDISRMKKQWNREYVVQEFGIYTYQANDLISYIRTKVNSMFGYDEAAKSFREYYATKENDTHKNQYTNIFKGKNVIVIHAESIQNFLISDDYRNKEPAKFNNQEVTPNLNRMAKEGLYFSNFYSEESAGTSSDTEFTFNSSLLPANSGTVFMNYFDREYITTPKLFKELGYTTSSMHANRSSAWNRQSVHPKLGYDKLYFYTDSYEIDEEIGLGLSDSSFFRQSIKHLKDIDDNNDKWYSLLIMLTNHTPFSDITRWEQENNKVFDVDYKYEKVDETTGKKVTVSAPYMEDTTLGNYMKSAHYADASIGEFIEGLDKEGLLDNTVIIIYGDHDNKLKKSVYNRYYNYDYKTDDLVPEDSPNYINVDDYFYELNRSVPFIIWTKDMKGTKYNKEITKVMGMMDVQPTLGNMFGFNNKYALGHDIFNIDNNVVVFPSGNWLTDKIYYNSAKEAYRQIDLSSEITLDYINYYKQYSEKMIEISNNIITYDLIKKVGENPNNELIEEVGDSNAQKKK